MIQVNKHDARSVYNYNGKVYLHTANDEKVSMITQENKGKDDIFTEQEWDFDARVKAFEYYNGTATFYVE